MKLFLFFFICPICFGELFLVKSNSTCLRLVGFVGFEVCDLGYSDLDSVVEFCPCGSSGIDADLPATKNELGSHRSTSKTNALPKLIKFDSSEEDEERELAIPNKNPGTETTTRKNGQMELASTTRTPTEMPKKDDLVGEGEEKMRKGNAATNCEECEYGVTMSLWLLIVAGILLTALSILIGAIVGFFIGKWKAKKEQANLNYWDRTTSVLDHGLPPRPSNLAPSQNPPAVPVHQSIPANYENLHDRELPPAPIDEKKEEEIYDEIQL